MTEHIEQGSAEWFTARCGKVTASRVQDIIAKTKSGYSASRKNYLAQLVVERLTGNVEEGFSNAAMQWGNDTEPKARDFYAFINDCEVAQVGFVNHPRIDMSGASPDGLVGDDGLVEIKCPNTATHINTLLTQKVPEKYMTQMLWQMACTDRLWCDFFSYDPRLPVNLQYFSRRINRDDKEIEALEQRVSEFLAELENTIKKLEEQS